MNIAQLLRRSAEVFPDRPALYSGAKLLLDYRTLAQRTASLAGYLKEQCGVKAGDRVAIFSANCPEYLEALNAILWAGAIAVPVNYKLHVKELAYVLGDCGARVLLVSPVLAGDAATVAGADVRLLTFASGAYAAAVQHTPASMQHREPEDVASLFYTSGTTGRPKGVMQTHRNLLAMTACYFTDVDDVAAPDAIVYAAPMSHGAGLYNYAFTLRGARHVVPASGGFDPAELVDLARDVGSLCFFAAPTMVKRLVDHISVVRAEVSGFKTIVYGGGPMYAEDIKQALEVMGPRFVQIYGQGESPMTITALSREQLADAGHSEWEQRIASVGVAQALVEVRVVDSAGQAVQQGVVGEIVVRGDTVMPGYWNKPEATADTLQTGWLYTGDTGCMDAHGFLTLKDRSKDLIITGGSNVYPREIEEVLLTHPAVSEVAVVGQVDAEWGEVPVAFVVLREGSGPCDAELDACCLQAIARFKRPKHYRYVSALPKNSYGKVLKTDLRAQLQATEATAKPAAVAG
ncbi:MAG: AMP-binding protein [Pseudomonadota bacterium]